MTIGRRGDKTFTGHNGVATDKLRALDGLRKTPEGQFGRTARYGEDGMRACIEAGRCPWCDAGPFKVLATHTLRRHAVSGQELREMAGLTKDASICDPGHSAEVAQRRLGQRLPDSAYERNRTAKRKFGAAGRAVQRAKLDAARSPERQRLVANANRDRILRANRPRHVEAVRLFREGMLLRDIAAAVSMHPRSVALTLRREGLITDGRGTRFRNPEFRQRVTDDLSRGTATKIQRDADTARRRLAQFSELGGGWRAIHALAADWGVSPKTVAAYLRKHGAVVPDGRSQREETL